MTSETISISRRKLVYAIIALGIVATLAATNPTIDQYQEYIRQTIVKDSWSSPDQGERTLGALFGGLASMLVVGQTIRHNYLLVSVYETRMDQKSMRAIGLLNSFIMLKKP